MNDIDFRSKLSDRAFLCFIHERLVNVHEENELFDYIQRLRCIITQIPPDQHTPNDGRGGRSMGELRHKLEIAEKTPAQLAESLRSAASYMPPFDRDGPTVKNTLVAAADEIERLQQIVNACEEHDRRQHAINVAFNEAMRRNRENAAYAHRENDGQQ